MKENSQGHFSLLFLDQSILDYYVSAFVEKGLSEQWVRERLTNLSKTIEVGVTCQFAINKPDWMKIKVILNPDGSINPLLTQIENNNTKS